MRYERTMAEPITVYATTWDILEQKHGVEEVPREPFFKDVQMIDPSPTLQEVLRRGRRSRLINERAKATRLVDPVLSELEMLRPGKIATLPEVRMSIKSVEGLSGCPDFLISGSMVHKIVPIVAIIEAKKDDIDEGLPQCAVELLVAHLVNQGRLQPIYGCVTTGDDWQFLRLFGDKKRVQVDQDLYYINDLPRLLGVLCNIVDTSLAALAATPETAPAKAP
jgi:hypothetical protein